MKSRIPGPISARTRHGGFTLIEVMVALVIVAFGMGAVLAALSNSAANVGALREKTLAQWVALNQVADARLNLQGPQTGTTEGDIKGFGNGDWHWQQIVTNVQQIPGLLQITVKVRRNKPGSISGSSSTSSASSTITSSTSASSAGADAQADWITTVIGFRGDAVAAASGETPEWAGSALGSSSSSSSSGSSSGGNVLNPGISSSSGSSSGTSSTSGSSLAPSFQSPGSSSSGGP
jgi:general secretion pathway protein I